MNQLEIIFPPLAEKVDVQLLPRNVSPSVKTENAVEGRRAELSKRFLAKVNKNGLVPLHVPNIGQCWEWTGCKNERGYGDVCTTGEVKKHDKAHRVSWLLTYGEIPSQSVLHKCDNPACVNPNHLFLGNHKTNAQDMLSKGRARNKTFKGEQNGFSKFTWEQVRELRRLYKTGRFSVTSIAAKFGRNRSHVGKIIRNEAWIE